MESMGIEVVYITPMLTTWGTVIYTLSTGTYLPQDPQYVTPRSLLVSEQVGSPFIIIRSNTDPYIHLPAAQTITLDWKTGLIPQGYEDLMVSRVMIGRQDGAPLKMIDVGRMISFCNEM